MYDATEGNSPIAFGHRRRASPRISSAESPAKYEMSRRGNPRPKEDNAGPNYTDRHAHRWPTCGKSPCHRTLSSRDNVELAGKIGSGFKEMFAGIGHTLVEGAKFSGENIKEFFEKISR